MNLHDNNHGKHGEGEIPLTKELEHEQQALDPDGELRSELNSPTGSLSPATAKTTGRWVWFSREVRTVLLLRVSIIYVTSLHGPLVIGRGRGRSEHFLAALKEILRMGPSTVEQILITYSMFMLNLPP